tara:strand:+ start:17952 stop:18680 length:729 start_codon:yes stop_codon:yes gene_type:complete
VSVSGFKQPIVFDNIQNMKAPYTPENVAVICYDILSGYSDISKVRLNQFTLKIDCVSESQTLDGLDAAAWVTAAIDFEKSVSELRTGNIDAVTMSVKFNGTILSMIHLGHELVHVAQYASKRLRQPITFGKNVSVKSAFSVGGKLIQKANRNSIPYYDRAWEWEAYGSQQRFAESIYTTLTGEIALELIHKEPSNFMDAMQTLQQRLSLAHITGFSNFPIQIKNAYGDAKVTGGKRDFDWGC